MHDHLDRERTQTTFNCGMCGRSRLQGSACMKCGSAFVVVDEVLPELITEPRLAWDPPEGKKRGRPYVQKQKQRRYSLPYEWSLTQGDPRAPRWVITNGNDEVVVYAVSETWAKHIANVLNLHREPKDAS